MFISIAPNKMINFAKSLLTVFTLFSIAHCRDLRTVTNNGLLLLDPHTESDCLHIPISNLDYCVSKEDVAPRRAQLQANGSQVDIMLSSKYCSLLTPKYHTLRLHYDRKLLTNVIVIQVNPGIANSLSRLHNDMVNVILSSSSMACTLVDSQQTAEMLPWLQRHLSPGLFIVFVCDHRGALRDTQFQSFDTYFNSFYTNEILLYYDSRAATLLRYICNVFVLSPNTYKCLMVIHPSDQRTNLDKHTNLIPPCGHDCANCTQKICTPFGKIIDSEIPCRSTVGSATDFADHPTLSVNMADETKSNCFIFDLFKTYLIMIAIVAVCVALVVLVVYTFSTMQS